jgi:hypothetical protein
VNDFLWKAADILDILHLVVVIPMILFAQKLFGKYFGGAFVYLVVSLQMACLSCPLTILSGWMRSFKDPTIDPNRTSFVHWLYGHLGFLGHLHWVLSALLLWVSINFLRQGIRARRDRKYTPYSPSLDSPGRYQGIR